MQSNPDIPKDDINVNMFHSSPLKVELDYFSCYYSNVQSIGNKFNEFSNSVDYSKP